MKTRIQKTIIAVTFVVFILFISGSSVFAATVAKIGNKNYSTLQAAVNNAKNGQTVKIVTTIKTKKTVSIKKKKITLDFRNLQYTCNKDGYAFIVDGGEVSFKNMKVKSSSGAIGIKKNTRVTFVSGRITGVVSSAGTLTVKSGTYTGAGYIDDSAAPAFDNIGSLNFIKGNVSGIGRMGIWNSGKCTINGGTFSTTKSGAVDNYEGAILTIKGGSFRATKLNEYQTLLQNWNGTLKIDNGTFKGCVTNSSKGSRRTLINGGTFRGDSGDLCLYNAKGNVVINGGNFTTTNYNTIWNDNDGNMTITGGMFVNKSNDWYYTLFNEGVLLLSGGTFKMNGQTKNSIGCSRSAEWTIVNKSVQGTIEVQDN